MESVLLAKSFEKVALRRQHCKKNEDKHLIALYKDLL